jgi:hypothetical protein
MLRAAFGNCEKNEDFFVRFLPLFSYLTINGQAGWENLKGSQRMGEELILLLKKLSVTLLRPIE